MAQYSNKSTEKSLAQKIMFASFFLRLQLSEGLEALQRKPVSYRFSIVPDFRFAILLLVIPNDHTEETEKWNRNH